MTLSKVSTITLERLPCLSKVAHPAYVSQIVDADEAPLRGHRPAVVGIFAAAIVLVLFAATLEPVRRTGRTLLGLAGIIPLTVTMTGSVRASDPTAAQQFLNASEHTVWPAAVSGLQLHASEA